MFNGVFSTVFNVDASVQAFAADLNSSDISSNDDFIQYPDQTDNQTYKNAILHNKSIPLSFAIEEDETQQRVDSNSELVNTSIQSGTLAGGEQAQTVVTSQGLLSEVFPEPEMDRPWFCSAYAAAGYFMCDPHTNIPKWCTYNLADIWCPDDPGFEYDPVTGGAGGDSGGAGAGRTWDVDKCFDENMQPKPCSNITTKGDKLCNGFFVKDPITGIADINQPVTYPQFKANSSIYTMAEFPCNDVTECYTSDMVRINCNQQNSNGGWFGFTPHTVYGTKWGCVYDLNAWQPVPCKFHFSSVALKKDSTYQIDSSLRLRDPITGLIIENERVQDGYPIPLPEPDPESDPFNPEYPVTDNECASIICQCISFVVKALEKVDQSILQVVAAVQALSFEVPTPAPFDISPVTDRLDDILTAVDNISIEMVKEAETNMWDFLGETISTLNDLIQYLIDQIIYLIVPEDTDFLRENFSMLREAMSMKLEPVNMLKTQITASLMTEQKNFEDIEMNLPIYGRVEFLNVEFLNYAVPKIRALISGIMIIVTSVWAYRKITSDMVR